jgi:hypothetical protein
VAPYVVGESAPDPALRGRVRHAVAAEEHLLIVERQPGDLPAHREAFEQELRAPPPVVVDRAGARGARLLDLADRPGAERVTQDEDVALGSV